MTVKEIQTFIKEAVERHPNARKIAVIAAPKNEEAYYILLTPFTTPDITQALAAMPQARFFGILIFETNHDLLCMAVDEGEVTHEVLCEAGNRFLEDVPAETPKE